MSDKSAIFFGKGLIGFLCCFSEYSLTHVDEVIDELLTTDYSCDIALPRIAKRLVTLLTTKRFDLYIVHVANVVNDTSLV